ncbi:SH3 domain-containing protein [Clostridium sp. CF011]|uniref:C40 family peptidase n=1 Tax=Clostridium sp. CF011 TaxID=2843318 RepID=UPI001C0AB839|nr:SH3 domain-containing protein [Clostridium sp. CF011]MBU3092072.1 SH3 domain-containing protein [Clostridium sp. CF011]WAG71353.1 SH3 domain-containing protein [Clostridium sp. CF011]
MFIKPTGFEKNLSGNEVDKVIYSNIPGLKEKMLCMNYWTKLSGMNKDIMNVQEIEAYNKSSLTTVGSIVDLENYEESFSMQELINKINTISSMPKSERFHEDGKLVVQEYYNKLIKNCNIEKLMDLLDIKYAITIRKTVMRTFPTYDKIFKTGDNYEFDRFQETAVYPVEPIVILLSSVDKKWYFAQMYNYLAWIPEKDVAISSKEEIFDYLKTENFLVTTGKRVFTNYNPLNEQLSEVKFDMGIKIPLADIKEIEGDIYGQNSAGNYVVKLPTRDNKGNVEFKKALIAKNEDISLGYLPYTRKNIIVNAFKFLGERYGWGGMFNSRDCASFIMDVYRTMGIKLPRNSEDQGKLAVGNFYEMPENMTMGDREKLLNKLKPGTPVFMNGHTMIYIGKEKGQYYAIHNFSGFYKPQQDGSLKYYKVREVMVSPLCIVLSEDGKTYIEGLYGARDFVNVD